MTAAIYGRVSTLDQDPTAQVEQLRTYRRARGWDAHEYVDHVLDPEALLDAGHAGEHLLREHGGIGHAGHLAQAKVAGAAARRRVGFSEISGERAVAASNDGGEAAHLLEQLFAARGHFGRSLRLLGAALEQPLPAQHVGGGVEQHALRGEAVATGAIPRTGRGA